jgi:hypothetical protein
LACDHNQWFFWVIFCNLAGKKEKEGAKSTKDSFWEKLGTLEVATL